jgi:hypothetical protein
MVCTLSVIFTIFTIRLFAIKIIHIVTCSHVIIISMILLLYTIMHAINLQTNHYRRILGSLLLLITLRTACSELLPPLLPAVPAVLLPSPLVLLVLLDRKRGSRRVSDLITVLDCEGGSGLWKGLNLCALFCGSKGWWWLLAGGVMSWGGGWERCVLVELVDEFGELRPCSFCY